MTYVPQYPDHWTVAPEYDAPPAISVTIHALNANKRPVGFAPWPKEKKRKRKKRK